MGQRDESDAEENDARRQSGDNSSQDSLAKRRRLGLCADCINSRLVEAKLGALFYLCELSATNPNFPKYPPLPVLNCLGYKAKA